MPTEKKDLLAGGVYTSMSMGGVTNVWGTPGRADGWDLERVIVEGYERSIWTFKSIEAISKHASTLPIQIGRGGDERQFEETLEDHPLLRLLNKRANPLETGDVFKKRLSAQLLLSKKGRVHREDVQPRRSPGQARPAAPGPRPDHSGRPERGLRQPLRVHHLRRRDP
ncbi:hypothetical protein [Streptomyces sp. NPDC005077]|uniref:hypothetical protein n=1 Tax=Streptomyces sp. NPDC005077 TaxID=3154292 RepID=UPI0033BBFB14